MNRRFEVCVDRVLRHEDSSYRPGDPRSGRLVKHPQDPGGHTRLGITLRTLRRWRGSDDVTPDDLWEMTHEEVKAIYHAFYWNAVRADRLPPGVDYVVFDFAVNSGPARAVKTLQELLRVTVDGVVGDETARAALAADRQQLIQDYCQRRLEFLQSLKTFSTFGRGWTRRVDEVERLALGDAEERLPVAEVAKTDTGKAAAFVASVVAAVTPLVEAARSIAPVLEGLPTWAAVAVAALATASMVYYWRSGRP